MHAEGPSLNWSIDNDCLALVSLGSVCLASSSVSACLSVCLCLCLCVSICVCLSVIVSWLLVTGLFSSAGFE